MTRKIHSASKVMLLFISSLYLHAQTPDTISVDYQFNPIIKTATKIAETQRNLAASVTAISLKNYQQTPSGNILNIVQQHVPGLYLTEWGVMGFGAAGSAAGKISMRGLGGTADTHILILRNGRPDMMGLMGCTIADEFMTDGIERIEVVRGPSSFLYGSSSSAGVINIISKKIHHNGFSTRLNANIGSFATQKLELAHGGKLNAFQYHMTGSIKQTDGHRSDSENPYEGKFFTGHLQYDFSPDTRIEYNTNYADILLSDPGMTTAPKQKDWYDIKRYGGDLTLNHQMIWGEAYLKLHGNFGKHKFADGWLSDDHLIGLMGYVNVTLIDNNKTTLGIDIKELGGNGENNILDWQGNPSVPYQEHSLKERGAYIHTQQSLTERWIASAGYRFDYNSQFGNMHLPQLGLVFKPFLEHSLRLNTSKGYRSPSLRELYFFPSHNETLKPDAVQNIEGGWYYQPNNMLNIDIAIFRLKGDNTIQLTPRTSGKGYQLTNSGKFENTGYEITSHLNLSPVNLSLNWSQVDMSKPIANVPGKKLSLNIQYQKGPWQFSTQWMHVKDWQGTDNAKPVANTIQMDDYTTGHLTINYTFYKMTIQLSVQNVLDANYEAMYGYPMPGRHWMAGISYEIQ